MRKKRIIVLQIDGKEEEREGDRSYRILLLYPILSYRMLLLYPIFLNIMAHNKIVSHFKYNLTTVYIFG